MELTSGALKCFAPNAGAPLDPALTVPRARARCEGT